MIVEKLYEQLAPQSQRVSEAETRALYEARKEEAHVYLLYSSSRLTALAAIEQIKSGEPFARVATRNSILGLLPPDGDLGFIPPGALPNPLDEALRDLAVGEVGGPYRTRDGWFVMQVSERRPREQPEYDKLQRDLGEMMRRRKFVSAYNRAYLDLKESYELRHVPGGAQMLFRVASPLNPVPPTEAMKAEPLVTYRGGRYTLGDAMTDLNRPEVQTPALNMLPAVEIWIESQVMYRISELEARRRHLHEDPDVVARVKARRDQAALEGGYNIATAGVPPAGPEQVALAWERVKPQFTRLVVVKLALIDSPDSALMMRIGNEAMGGGSLAEAAKKVAGAPEPVLVEVRFPDPGPDWSVYEALFTQQKPGDRFGPFKTPQTWRIFQMLDKQTAQQQWDEIPEALRQNIAGSANELARDQRFREFTDSLSAAYAVRVDSALVARLRWPARPAMGRL
jgi:parvulin-like peptidyl-prolyl isomerase